MELLLAIIFAIALLVLIVFGLHKYQTLEVEQNADRYSPLPPLDPGSKDSLNLEDAENDEYAQETESTPEDYNDTSIPTETESHRPNELSDNAAADVETEPTPTAIQTETVAETPVTDSAEFVKVTESENLSEQNSSTGVSEAQKAVKPEPLQDEITTAVDSGTQANGTADALTTPSATTAKKIQAERQTEAETQNESATEVNAETEVIKPTQDSAALTDLSWQEQVAELKKDDNLDEALAICQQEYPLWGAYSQASIIIRAKIKQSQSQQLGFEEDLHQLYKTSTVAELLHAKAEGAPPLSAMQLKKLDLQEINALEMPYAAIGYEQIRLLKKNDIKLLQQCWGEPTQHQSPRALHQGRWNQLLATLEQYPLI